MRGVDLLHVRAKQRVTWPRHSAICIACARQHLWQVKGNRSRAQAKKGKGKQGDFCTIGQSKTDAIAALNAVFAVHQTRNRGGAAFKFRIGNNRANIRIAIAKNQRGFIRLMLCAIF